DPVVDLGGAVDGPAPTGGRPIVGMLEVDQSVGSSEVVGALVLGRRPDRRVAVSDRAPQRAFVVVDRLELQVQLVGLVDLRPAAEHPLLLLDQLAPPVSVGGQGVRTPVLEPSPNTIEVLI